MHVQYGFLLAVTAFALAGCSLSHTPGTSHATGVSLQGSIHGGQQPVVGSHVYLMAASTNGYGMASTSLITSGQDGTDAVGSYVLSDPNGQFTITGDYSCTQGQQVYVYALGGNPGAGSNAAAGFLAAVGTCPAAQNFLTTVPFIGVNELSTVAFAYAVAGFTVDPLHVASSGTALAQVGIANAFANTANLLHGATTPGGNGAVPLEELDTLSNILASCLNTTGAVSGPSNPTACYTLFNAASGATDTAGAAINIAHQPAANVSALFGLQPSNGPFMPALASAPNDFTVAIAFTGGGLATSTAETNYTCSCYNNIAVDSAGNIWKPNYDANSLTELSPLGVPLSGSGGFTGGGLSNPANVAIDLNDSVWTADVGSNNVSKFGAGGQAASGSPFTGGGVSAPNDLAIDGSGNAWILNSATVTELTNAGVNASGSPFSTNTLSAPIGIAILPSGTVWVSNPPANSVSVYTNTGPAVPGSPYTTGGLNFPYGLAFDASGNGWAADQNGLSKLSAAGTAASGSPYLAPSGASPNALAIDGTGNIWVTGGANQSILETDNSGTYLSGATGFQYGASSAPESIAVDGSGNVWYNSFNDATIHELVGAGSPVATPLAYGVKNSMLGTRP